MKRGFSTSKYLRVQKKEILKRKNRFDRLYLEVGGHLCYDGHASRVLPGYDPEIKLKLIKSLLKIPGEIEIVYCINANDIDSKKLLGDFKLNYKKQALRDLRIFKKHKINVDYVIITRFKIDSLSLRNFKKILEKKVKNVYIHKEILHYLESPKYAIKGYEKNDYMKLKSKITVITGAAGGSGKMATAMSQIYHDLKKNINSGFAKFETFPVWNLPLKHSINLAYEAATADLQDKNIIDPYHLKHYNIKAVNYNRDVKNFSILMKLANLITKSKSAFGYHSPTDMGIGNTKSGIINEKICEDAAIKEIRRRMKVYKKEFKAGRDSKKTIWRMNEIIKEIN